MTGLAADDEIDAVYIASPNSLHAEQAIMMLRAGKHVLVEKPLGANAREVHDMAAEAAQADRILMEAYVSPWEPNIEGIGAGLRELGQLRRVVLVKDQYSSRYDRLKSGELPNAFNPEFAAGSLMDLGFYPVALSVLLFGTPSSVHASGLMLPSGVDGQGTVLLGYDGFEVACLHSKIAPTGLGSADRWRGRRHHVRRLQRPHHRAPHAARWPHHRSQPGAVAGPHALRGRALHRVRALRGAVTGVAGDPLARGRPGFLTRPARRSVCTSRPTTQAVATPVDTARPRVGTGWASRTRAPQAQPSARSSCGRRRGAEDHHEERGAQQQRDHRHRHTRRACVDREPVGAPKVWIVSSAASSAIGSIPAARRTSGRSRSSSGSR